MKETTKELTKTILILAGVTVLIPTLAIAPGLGYALKPLLKNKNFYPSHIDRAVKRLKKQRLISVSEKDDKVTIKLTENGRRRVLGYNLADMKLRTGKWDGWWRIVVFDIPEKKRRARDFLRSKMQELGFYMLQKSVFVTPWECHDEIDFVRHFYEVEEYVNLIRAKKFEGEDLVKNYFELD